MSQLSKANLVALRSLFVIGAMLSAATGAAIAGDNVAEDQILRALAAPGKLLTLGVLVGQVKHPLLTAHQNEHASRLPARRLLVLQRG